MERYLPYFDEQAKHRSQMMSADGWVKGIYFGRALGSCFPKGTKYPKEPMEFWGDSTSEEDSEPFTDADRFACFAAAFNKNNFG